MIFEDLRNADFSDLGNAPGSVRYLILSFALILILVGGYYLLIDDKRIELEQSRQQELVLLAVCETSTSNLSISVLLGSCLNMVSNNSSISSNCCS